MPEGHTIHRAARDHRKALIGHRINVSSPQGRFSDGAKILDMQICSAIEAFGKHLFYKFMCDMYLHIHLGLFGRIRKTKAPAMAPRGQVRVRLVGGDCCVDISGPTICSVRNQDEFDRLASQICRDRILFLEFDFRKVFSKPLLQCLRSLVPLFDNLHRFWMCLTCSIFMDVG